MSVGKEPVIRIPDEDDLYKLEFKYYKARRKPPDLSRVRDPRGTSEKFKWRSVKIGSNVFGIEETLKVTEIDEIPGLLIVPNVFTCEGLRLWSHNCLFEYPERPNVTSLESLPVSLSKRIEDGKIALDVDLRKKLRWATLGYHHDWNTKKYNMQHYSEFPPTLADCAAIFAEKVANYEYRYKAEAAIVNYYPIGTTLAGHVDYSEEDQTAPLISISLGCTCIFLIGGPSKSIRPTALYLRSGDVVIMTGQSRLAYHGVPRVFQETSLFPEKDEALTSTAPENQTESTEILETLRESYLKKNRININIRQVHKPDV